MKTKLGLYIFMFLSINAIAQTDSDFPMQKVKNAQYKKCTVWELDSVGSKSYFLATYKFDSLGRIDEKIIQTSGVKPGDVNDVVYKYFYNENNKLLKITETYYFNDSCYGTSLVKLLFYNDDGSSTETDFYGTNGSMVDKVILKIHKNQREHKEVIIYGGKSESMSTDYHYYNNGPIMAWTKKGHYNQLIDSTYVDHDTLNLQSLYRKFDKDKVEIEKSTREMSSDWLIIGIKEKENSVQYKIKRNKHGLIERVHVIQGNFKFGFSYEYE